MRVPTYLSLSVLPVVASMLPVAFAQAEAPAPFAQGGNAITAVASAPDAKDTTVRRPDLHWTARIGSGTTAQQEDADKTVHEDTQPEASAGRRPEIHWSSLIGTGTADPAR